MKKICILVFIIFFILPYSFTAEPSYAKWGKIAVENTKLKYSNYDIVDYLYVGKENISKEIAKETFKLWLRNKTDEFGIIVEITFQKNSNKIIQITYRKTYK